MSDIFVSYSHPDRNKAEQLARIFERQGWSVWWDRELAAGSRFAEVIAAELSGAKAVVTLWSQSSVASNWVKDEAQEGAARNALVPVLLDRVNLPLGFRQFQAADLSGWDGSASHTELQRLVRSIGGLINKPVSEPEPPIVGKSITLYLLAGAAIVLLLTLAAYRFWPGGETGNRNQRVGENSDVSKNNNQGKDTTACDEAKQSLAANLTSNGIEKNDPDARTTLFDQATHVCPTYPNAYFWRAQSYVALINRDKAYKDKAIADFKQFVKLTDDADRRSQAQELISGLEATPTPTPVIQNTNTVSTSNVNTAANTNNSTNANKVTTPPRVSAQVSEMFVSDKATRITATTRLIIEKNHDAATVQAAVKTAITEQRKLNYSGVINTLVYLENVDPAILKQNRVEIEQLLDEAKENGPETTGHINRVKALLRR